MPHSGHRTPPANLPSALETTEDAMSALAGILRGMAFDGILTDGERGTLQGWIAGHRHLMRRHPFSEIIPRVEFLLACKDGILPLDEAKETVYLCRRFGRHQLRHDMTVKDLQELHGILYGIAADGIINEAELGGLDAWLAKHPNLHVHWPHAELTDILGKKRKRQPLTPAENAFLLHFCSALENAGA